MANTPAAGAPAAITASHHPVEQRRMPPSLAGHCRRPGESLLCANACLGLLLCRDAGFYLLIGIGLCLLAWEREPDSQEVSIIAWEEGFVAFAHMLQEVHAEHDASRAHANVVRWDFFT
jgi:hypothetical protein